jgi:hypothetical protein
MADKVTIIDVTPTWEQIVSTLVLLLTNGNAEARKFAQEEMTRMAKLADKHVALVKAGVV